MTSHMFMNICHVCINAGGVNPRILLPRSGLRAVQSKRKLSEAHASDAREEKRARRLKREQAKQAKALTSLSEEIDRITDATTYRCLYAVKGCHAGPFIQLRHARHHAHRCPFNPRFESDAVRAQVKLRVREEKPPFIRVNILCNPTGQISASLTTYVINA